MTLVCVTKIKFRVKGHHWYKYKYTVGEELECIAELENQQRSHTVPANTKKRTGITKNQ